MIRPYCFSLPAPARISLLQSWTKVLGTIVKYSYSSVISRFPLKTVQRFRNFLQLSFPPPYTKLKLGKNSGCTRPTLFVRWGEGLDLCELENAHKCENVPRLLFMIVWKRGGKKKKAVLRGFQACKSVFSGSWWKIVIEQIFSQLFGVFWTWFKNSLDRNDIHQKLWNLITRPLF